MLVMNRCSVKGGDSFLWAFVLKRFIGSKENRTFADVFLWQSQKKAFL